MPLFHFFFFYAFPIPSPACEPSRNEVTCIMWYTNPAFSELNSESCTSCPLVWEHADFWPWLLPIGLVATCPRWSTRVVKGTLIRGWNDNKALAGKREGHITKTHGQMCCSVWTPRAGTSLLEAAGVAQAAWKKWVLRGGAPCDKTDIRFI